MEKISWSVNGAENRWLTTLKDFIEDKWVVGVSDITCEKQDDGGCTFGVMLNTLGDFDRVSGRSAPLLRNSEFVALAYGIAGVGLDGIDPEKCRLHFGPTFEDGIRSFLYERLSAKHEKALREKYFDPENMTRFVIRFGKAFCIFKTHSALRDFETDGKFAELKAEMISLLRECDTFGVVTDLEHVVFCRTTFREREILPDYRLPAEPAMLMDVMSEHYRRDAAVYASSVMGVTIVAVEYHFDARSLTHRYTLIPAADEDMKRLNMQQFRCAEENLCAMFRRELGGELSRGEVICCVISPCSFETLTKKHVRRSLERGGAEKKLQERFSSGGVKVVHIHGLTAVAVFGSKSAQLRFELSGSADEMNEHMKHMISGCDSLNVLDYSKRFTRCMTAAEYEQEYRKR